MCGPVGPHIATRLDARLRAPGPHDFAVRRSHRSCARGALLTVARPAKPFAPMPSAPTATRPAFVTIAIRPLSLGRVVATHTRFPNFGKAEYFRQCALTYPSRVLPAGQHKGLWPAVNPARFAPVAFEPAPARALAPTDGGQTWSGQTWSGQTWLGQTWRGQPWQDRGGATMARCAGQRRSRSASGSKAGICA